MIPEEGDILTYEYCGRHTTATTDMDYWYCLSEVKGGEEILWIFFCSHNCLKAYMNENPLIKWERTRLKFDMNSQRWTDEERRSGRMKD